MRHDKDPRSWRNEESAQQGGEMRASVPDENLVFKRCILDRNQNGII